MYDISKTFRGDFTHVRSGPVTDGYAMGFAKAGQYGYLLVQGRHGKADTVRKIHMESGNEEATWEIGKNGAAAMTFDGSSLWVMSRNRAAFLRQVSLDGDVARTVPMDDGVPGKYYGLAHGRGRFYFSSQHEGKSRVYEMGAEGGVCRERYSFPEKIYSLAWQKGCLYAFQTAFDTYANHWLIIMDLQKRTSRKMRFLTAHPWALAGEDGRFYAMVRDKNRAVVYPFVVLPKSKLILGNPMTRRVTMTYRFVNGNRNPYTCDLWAAYPIDRDFQNVANIAVKPQPAEVVKDMFGNPWMRIHWERETAGHEATISFDVTNVAAACTLDKKRLLKRPSFPKAIRAAWTRETYSFDYSAPAVTAALKGVRKEKHCLSQILAIRNCVNDALTVVGPSGPESKASLFLAKGEGRCYAHTLCFAALARAHGIPARAIGGTHFETRRSETEIANEHTWNQVYVPRTGWVDIDTVTDDAKDGKHRFNAIGYRPNRFFITFVGDYDRFDPGRVFTQRGWYRSYRWASLDRANRAAVKLLPAEIKSDPLEVMR